MNLTKKERKFNSQAKKMKIEWRDQMNHGMESDMKKTICIDLDGVIQDFPNCSEDCDYTKYPDLRFVKRDRCPEKHGAKEVLQRLSKKFRIIIFTARIEMEREVTEKWLRENEIPYNTLIMGKPRALLYVDDFGLRFTSWETLEEEIEMLTNDKKEVTRIHDKNKGWNYRDTALLLWCLTMFITWVMFAEIGMPWEDAMVIWIVLFVIWTGIYLIIIWRKRSTIFGKLNQFNSSPESLGDDITNGRPSIITLALIYILLLSALFVISKLGYLSSLGSLTFVDYVIRAFMILVGLFLVISGFEPIRRYRKRMKIASSMLIVIIGVLLIMLGIGLISIPIGG